MSEALAIPRIAVLTSGGDAPGMNAAIRAVVRMGVARGAEVYGVENGYLGLIKGKVRRLGLRDVGGILQNGGTFLGSARCPQFAQEPVRLEALARLKDLGIGGLVVIGGNGSQTGALALKRHGFPVTGVASTIDNDLYGSDITIGVDTALNVALEAIDRLKTTASSHHRAFVVEVMGRDCGYLALAAGVAGGAEVVVIPEVAVSAQQIAQDLRAAYERGKTHALVVVAEGASLSTEELVRYVKDHQKDIGFDLRSTILGHVQRGGAPGAADRLLAARLGGAAVNDLIHGRHGHLCGIIANEVARTPLETVCAQKKPLPTELLELVDVMRR